MSDTKHPFKGIKLKRKATTDEVNSARELAKESFQTYITDCFRDRQNCFMVNNTTVGTTCQCFKIIVENEESLSKLCEIIADATVLDRDSRNKFMQDVIGGGHTTQINQQKRNNIFDRLPDIPSCFVRNSWLLISRHINFP